MTSTNLSQTAQAMVAPGKGILAADESTPTIGKRFASIGVESTESLRRDYRSMLFAAPSADQYISGVILFDETLRQTIAGWRPIPQYLAGRGMIPESGGQGRQAHSARGEKGHGRLTVARALANIPRPLGARFAKWRGGGCDRRRARPAILRARPTPIAWRVTAALCREPAGPIVEPEVLHGTAAPHFPCEQVTARCRRGLRSTGSAIGRAGSIG